MKPPFNSFPRPPPPDARAPPFNQQVFQAGMPMQNTCNPMQAQAQMRMFNPRLPFPLGASAVPGMINQAGFMNAFTGICSSQNNLMGMPQFNPGVVFSQSGPSPQLGLPNMVPWQLCNQAQNSNQFNQNPVPQGQLFPNFVNLPQQPNQNMGLLNPLLNMSPHLPMHSPGPQMFAGALPNGQLACLNANLHGNQLSALLQSNQMQQQLNDYHQKLANAGELNSSSIAASQGTPIKYVQSMRDPSGNQVGGRASQQGFQKPQYPSWGNGKRKFGFSNEHQGKAPGNKFLRTDFAKSDSGGTRMHKFQQKNMKRNGRVHKGKGLRNGMPTESAATGSEDLGHKKRSFAIIYTEKEIRVWREERKRNYPSKANIEKKLSGKDPEVMRKRAQQLKEILAKQAELGVEVAEIPSSYLAGSEKKGHLRKGNRKPMRKRGEFGKKQNRSDGNASYTKRSPSLLEKLLSADIKKDKMALLQIFRFMVANSFFSNWPEAPLHFHQVVVKESACDGEITEDILSLVRTEENNGKEIVGDEKNNGEQLTQAQKPIYGVGSMIEGKAKAELYDEEEGEITD